MNVYLALANEGGGYVFKNANIKPLFEQAIHLINGFEKIELKLIARSLNKEADKLANKAINLSGLKHPPSFIG